MLFRSLVLPGYGAQYVWDTTGRAPTYAQDDMLGPTSVLALGHGGMGHLHGGAFTTAAGRPEDYISALNENRVPDALAWSPPPRFDPAFYVTDRACRGALSERSFAAVFGHSLAQAFGPELAFLRANGLLEHLGDRWSKPAGRGFNALHLLAFLLGDASHGALPPPPSAALATTLEVTGTAADVARLTELAAAKPRAVRLTVAQGTDAASARELLRTASSQRIPIELTPRTDASQYDAIDAEFPPSLIWCRLAMRAAESARRLVGGVTDRL